MQILYLNKKDKNILEVSKLSTDKLYDGINEALKYKREYDKQMKKLCEYLIEVAPKDNIWYYNSTGFLQVDVKKEEYDEYIGFMEDLVGCSYCYLMNPTGLTLMMNINTLKDKIVEK